MYFVVVTFSRWHKTFIILLYLTPDDFTRQEESSRSERTIQLLRTYFVNLVSAKSVDMLLSNTFSTGWAIPVVGWRTMPTLCIDILFSEVWEFFEVNATV